MSSQPLRVKVLKLCLTLVELLVVTLTREGGGGVSIVCVCVCVCLSAHILEGYSTMGLIHQHCEIIANSLYL